MSLNRTSPVPLYYQLAEALREQIRAGEWQAGDRLPPERVLAEQHGISRMTARQAVSYLVREGTLVVRHGLGTYVAAPRYGFDAFHLFGFSEDARAQGAAVRSRVIEHGPCVPPRRVARQLRLADSDDAMRLVRLRRADETAVLLETLYLPMRYCTGWQRSELEHGSIYALLEQRGVRLARAEQSLEATIANEYESRLFGIEQGAPMILLEGVTSDAHGQPIEYFKAVYRGDRFTFRFASERGLVMPLTAWHSAVGRGHDTADRGERRRS
jgi:GntR family transcriptional regulator